MGGVLMSEPRAIVVKRWVCGGVYCTRSYSKRETTLAHMTTCWKVPENRACLSCAHLMIYDAGFDDYVRDRVWSCKVGIPLEPGKPVVGCEKWEQVA